MIYAAIQESSSFKKTSTLGLDKIIDIHHGNYSTPMVREVEDLVEQYQLKEKSLVVWGGSKKEGHDLPFRFRVTVDWFRLPTKPVSVVEKLSEAQPYEYMISPWDLSKRYAEAGYEERCIYRSKQVWLYHHPKNH